MRTAVPSAFAVALAAAVWGGAVDTAAQVRRPIRTGVPASALLVAKPVQDELKLSADQVRRAQEAFDRDREAREAIEAGPADKADERWREMLAESDKRVTAILAPAQLKRFRQLRLQQAGAVALADRKLADELELTADQRAAVQAVVADRAAKAEKVIADPAPTAREVAVKLTELTKAADGAVRKLLTADQRAKWEGMLGEPFRWPPP